MGRVIFVDTSFWVALIARRDDRHDVAVPLLRRYGTEPLITSSHVRGETWTFLGRRYGHSPAVSFLDTLDRTTRIHVEFVDQDVEAQAIGWFRRHDERKYSFVDATSVTLMRSLRIRRALAFDGGFEAAGFEELRA